MRATHIDTLGAAMVILSGDISSPDGVAEAAVLEAGQRLQKIAVDLAVVQPMLALAAGSEKTDRRVRAACSRLAAEVTA